ncbi:monocarboxylate transporter 12-like isoform X2 [Leptidea sinapis]|uniref:monocarboxylate transporter 12-like isoform X2 n=1 Tax=Leptidea sinapis TaxID=189913 RepID=UPI002138B481|nr:monocarboxylate transporter 12-like isoform X2 [Leptidea sinapis]
MSNLPDVDKWGYVVCFGTVITFIAGIGHVNSFGLIYNDFIIDTNSTAKSLTTAHGLFAIMLAVGGILLNIIAKHISLKSGGLTGAALFITGAFTTILITNANQLPITFGILQGIGFGMMVPVCFSSINFYFVRKRTFAMSLVKAIQGIIVMWYPQLLRVIVSFYGFRGVLIILSGISLHTIPGMLTMECGNKTTKIHLNKINWEI